VPGFCATLIAPHSATSRAHEPECFIKSIDISLTVLKSLQSD